jgi:hypothetical protein
MIKGDIDLTENLDFRYDSSDKLPQKLYNTVPWKEEDDSSVTTITYTIYDSISNSNISLFYNNSTYNTTIQTSIQWQDLNVTGWYSNSNTFNDTFIENLYNNVYHFDNSSLYEDNMITYNFEPAKLYSTKKSIFGLPRDWDSNITKHIYDVKNAIRGHKYIYEKTAKHDLRHDKHRDFDFKEPFYYDQVPWSRKKKKQNTNNSRKYNGVRLCPWMDNMQYRIYNDYIDDLFQENDYSKYLTDMAWLGL